MAIVLLLVWGVGGTQVIIVAAALLGFILGLSVMYRPRDSDLEVQLQGWKKGFDEGKEDWDRAEKELVRRTGFRRREDK